MRSKVLKMGSTWIETTIKKGSIYLKFYITGSLIGELNDKNQNGELIETTGSSVDTVAGIVLYDEGIIMLTASHKLEEGNLGIKYNGTAQLAPSSSWKYYGATLNDGITYDSTIMTASFGLTFKGTSYTNTMTMFCHAKKGELNYSNNPTYKKVSEAQVMPDTTGSQYSFNEREYGLKNIASSSYTNIEEDFQKN